MPDTWSLVTVGAGGQTAVAVLRSDGALVAVPELGGHDLHDVHGLMDVMERWADVRPTLEAFDPWSAEILPPAPLLAPLRYPHKVLCSGPNYTDHLAEMGEQDLGAGWTPYFFLKPPSTAVIGPGDDIPIPADPEARADWEGELAVVIGRTGRDIGRRQALEHVAGYAVANDISLRGPHRRPDAPAPFVWDWVASKAGDGSLPMGPGVVPAWLVPNPQDLAITTTVNGAIMQQGTTANMVVGIADLVAAASALLTLEPGDVIVTGTPAGVGAGRGVFLQHGDAVTVEIPGIGRLENTVVAMPTATRGDAS